MSKSIVVHHMPDPHPDRSIPDPNQSVYSKTILGFWVYLMADCLLFGSLFATYAVLHNSTFGGPSAAQLFSLPLAFTETMILLISSVTSGIAMLAIVKDRKKAAFVWLAITFLLGISFVAIELYEFHDLVVSGNSWRRSAFLSAFFTLVGTHGLHVSIGLLWMAVMMVQLSIKGITVNIFRRFAVFTLFWHFLDLVWIFIFTFVYLIGVV